MRGRLDYNIKRKLLMSIAFISAMTIFLSSPTVLSLDNHSDPQEMMQNYFEMWEKILKDPTLPDLEKENKYQKIVDDFFHIRRLSRQFLSNDWQKLDEYTQQRFSIALRKDIAKKIKNSPLLAESNYPWQLNFRNKTIKERNATLDFDFVGKNRQSNIKVFLLKSVEGDWKITNVKIANKNSLVRHYYKFCKRILDDYPVPYLIAELGEDNYVVLEDFESGTIGKIPPNWTWKSSDDPERKPYVVRSEDHNKYLEATDRGESVIIGKEIKWNIKKYPYVSFRWRAHKIPKGGDERYGKTVDSAAGIYFIYKKKLGLIPESVKYVWSSTLPVGSAMRRSGIGKPWMVVADSGEEHLGEWRTYVFNAYEAYQKTFGGNPPDETVGIGILSDANSTHSMAYADYDDIRALKNANADSGVKEILEAE